MHQVEACPRPRLTKHHCYAIGRGLPKALAPQRPHLLRGPNPTVSIYYNGRGVWVKDRILVAHSQVRKYHLSPNCILLANGHSQIPQLRTFALSCLVLIDGCYPSYLGYFSLLNLHICTYGLLMDIWTCEVSLQ